MLNIVSFDLDSVSVSSRQYTAYQALQLAAATVAQSVKRSELRSLKRGTTELMLVQFPAVANELGAKILATLSVEV